MELDMLQQKLKEAEIMFPMGTEFISTVGSHDRIDSAPWVDPRENNIKVYGTNGSPRSTRILYEKVGSNWRWATIKEPVIKENYEIY